MSKYRSFALNAGLIVLAFLVVSAFQTRHMLQANGHPAPELRGVTLSGAPYDLGNAREKPALVYFFAPWCKICAASADNLNRLRRWRDEDELEIIAVALDWKFAHEVEKYVERHDLNVTVVLGNTTVRGDWQIQAYPSYYVLDSQHRVVRRDIGYSTQFGLWWRAWIQT